jgi:hypothetical protein
VWRVEAALRSVRCSVSANPMPGDDGASIDVDLAAPLVVPDDTAAIDRKAGFIAHDDVARDLAETIALAPASMSSRPSTSPYRVRC